MSVPLRVGGLSTEEETVIIAQVISEMFIKPRSKVLKDQSINVLFAMGRGAIRKISRDYPVTPARHIFKHAVEQEFTFYECDVWQQGKKIKIELDSTDDMIATNAKIYNATFTLVQALSSNER
jgi:hypothetical protein